MVDLQSLQALQLPGPVSAMSLFSRSVLCSVLCLLCMISGVCAGQATQFMNPPDVQPTGGRVTSFLTGVFQQPSGGTDILYVNAPMVGGGTSPITIGELLNQGGAGFANSEVNQITFSDVSNLAAAEGDFMGWGVAYAFAMTPMVPGTTILYLYAGTGAQAAPKGNPTGGGPSFGAVGEYILVTSGTATADIETIAAFPFKVGLHPQLLLEDRANGYLYILSLNGASVNSLLLSGVVVSSTIKIPDADGAGPIYVGDFNGDGNMDFIVNNQAGSAATVYLGDGAGGVAGQPIRYVFDAGVRSMLMQDMDGDGIADMVGEGGNGRIEIHKGNADGTFAIASEGGTALLPGSAAGEGGRLAAINPRTLDILTTTPIGLSLLRPQSGTLTYTLKTIYNIGSGRTSFALADFHGTGNLDLAVDSAEGVAIIRGNSDGTFQASKAYSALAPGLSAAVGKFRNFKNNPTGNRDVVVGTGATQAQLLTGNGDGTLGTFPGVVDTGPWPYGNVSIPAQLWSNILAGDFDGDGNLDLLYSFTGVPRVASGGDIAVIFLQYGNGDGTFNPPSFNFGFTSFFPGAYGESTISDFNGDGLSDLLFSDSDLEGDWLGFQGHNYLVPGSGHLKINPSFSQVAAGFFKANRSSQQDYIFQLGASFIPSKNAQDGTGKNFTEMPAVTGPDDPYNPSTVLLTDIDGDGNGDLVVVYYGPTAVGAGQVASGHIYIWYGNGDGTFAKTPQVLTLSRNYYLGAVADMNSDGLPDLVLSDGSLVSILHNQGGRSFGTLLANGQFSSEQHFLAGQGINSISLADVNGDGVPDLIVANGGATISNVAALGGRTATSITLQPNPPDINTGGITVLLNSFGIATQPVTGSLIESPEPSATGATFTLTATITPSPGVAPPTGAVQFSIDGATVGSAVYLAPGTTNSTASYQVPAGSTYASGVHPVSAFYVGDAVNSPITLAGITGTHAVANGATTTELFLCIGPTIACPSTGIINPHPQYIADLQMYYGQTWNGTTDAFANDGSVLTGNLTLVDVYNGVPLPLCTLPVVNGGACPPSVGTTQGTSVGTNVLIVTYPGDSAHNASTSPSVTIIVLPDTTAATLAGSPNPSPARQAVAFTAILTGNFAAPTGPVVFTYGGTVIGTSDLVPGATGFASAATLTTSVLPVGVDIITASYAATLDFAGASATFSETITPSLAGNFTLNVTPTPVSVGVGYSTLLAVTVTPRDGFSQDVNLACANLPSETTCFFDTATLAGGGNTSLVVATTAPHSCGTAQPYFLGANGGGPRGLVPIAVPAFACVLAMFLPGRRRWLRALIALTVGVMATQITGCGNCSDLGTRPATYTFRITASSTGTTEVESQPVTITVTI